MTEGEAGPGVSPYASGGGGTVLEHLYGAILLSSLLVGDPVTELGDDATTVSVRFQGRSLSPVDDLIVSGSARDRQERRAAIRVRRAPDLTSSDTKTARLLAGYVRMVAERWDDVTAGRWRLYLAVAVPSPAVNQLRELTVTASAATDEAGFRAEVRRPRRVDQSVRDRLVHVDALIASAAKQAGTAAAGIGAGGLTWRVLHSLKLRVLRLEGGDTADRTHAVSRLRLLTPEGTAAAGDDLFARTAELAGQYASAGAEVNADQLHADLGIPLFQPRPRSRPAVSADAMLRGPVAALGLTGQLSDADEKLGTDPAAAGGLYGVVADKLQGSPYAPQPRGSAPGRRTPSAPPATTPRFQVPATGAGPFPMMPMQCGMLPYLRTYGPMPQLRTFTPQSGHCPQRISMAQGHRHLLQCFAAPHHYRCGEPSDGLGMVTTRTVTPQDSECCSSRASVTWLKLNRSSTARKTRPTMARTTRLGAVAVRAHTGFRFCDE